MTQLQSSASSEEWKRTRRLVSYGVIAIAALIGTVVAFSIYFRATQPGPWTGPPFLFGFGWVWPIFGFFIVFLFLRWVFWPWHPYSYRYSHWSSSDAVSILRERYARGELTKEQFDRMMQDLRDHN